MTNKKIAKEPFRFYTSSLLVEITGKKADDLKSFVDILKSIDESSIFYHIHHSFREYTFAPGEYSNDFARFVAESLEDRELAEQLTSINVKDFTDLNSLRLEIIKIIENHTKEMPNTNKVPHGREFYFLKNVGIISATPYVVSTIYEFIEALDKVGMRSLYYHFFDARLRLGRKTNDFSNWIRNNFENDILAQKIEDLDPYFITMDELKIKIINLCLGDDKKEIGFIGKIIRFFLGNNYG